MKCYHISMSLKRRETRVVALKAVILKAKETFPILCLRENTREICVTRWSIYSFQIRQEGQKVSNSVIVINFIV